MTLATLLFWIVILAPVLALVLVALVILTAVIAAVHFNNIAGSP